MQSDKLRLRELIIDDVGDAYLSWMKDMETMRFLESRFSNHTIASLKEFVASMQASEDNVMLAITLKESGLHVGNVRLGPIDRNHDTAPLGILIGEKGYRGAGLGVEAIEAATKYAFSLIGLRKLTAGVYSVNTASIKAFSRAGWTCEGILRKQYVYQGRAIDGHIFGCLAPEEETDGR